MAQDIDCSDPWMDSGISEKVSGFEPEIRLPYGEIFDLWR